MDIWNQLQQALRVDVGDLNWVDLAIVVLLITYALGGLRRGFVAGFGDLIGMAVAFVFAAKLYGPTVAWLAERITLPQILLNFIALIGLFAIGQAAFSLIVGPLLRFIQRVLLPGPLGWLNALAGIVPGLIKGAILVGVLAALFALFPINAKLTEEIRGSVFGAQFSEGVAALAPQLEALTGNSPYDSALFVTQPTEQEAARKLNVPGNISLQADALAEQRMVDLVNAERTKAGLGPVSVDPRLREAARAHSEDMFRQGYFAHESPDGKSPADRLRSVNVPFLVMGENLAYAPSVEVAHTGLMNSPGHRRNILAPSFGHIGIGVIDGGLYGKMFSQEFTN